MNEALGGECILDKSVVVLVKALVKAGKDCRELSATEEGGEVCWTSVSTEVRRLYKNSIVPRPLHFTSLDSPSPEIRLRACGSSAAPEPFPQSLDHSTYQGREGDAGKDVAGMMVAGSSMVELTSSTS